MTKNKQGKFITFEGLDGSGASTQISLLVKRLQQDGYKAFSTKEPTNNIIGGLIRGVLTKTWQTSSEGIQLLFAADRAHHLYSEIIPALKEGKIIISDRYFLSTFAFGSIDLPLDWLQKINERFIHPDLTFILKVRPEICLERIDKSRNGFEFFEEKEKLKKSWETYEKLGIKDKSTHIIDGERSIEVISEEIFKIVKGSL